MENAHCQAFIAQKQPLTQRCRAGKAKSDIHCALYEFALGLQDASLRQL